MNINSRELSPEHNWYTFNGRLSHLRLWLGAVDLFPHPSAKEDVNDG